MKFERIVKSDKVTSNNHFAIKTEFLNYFKDLRDLINLKNGSYSNGTFLGLEVPTTLDSIIPESELSQYKKAVISYCDAIINHKLQVDTIRLKAEETQLGICPKYLKMFSNCELLINTVDKNSPILLKLGDDIVGCVMPRRLPEVTNE